MSNADALKLLEIVLGAGGVNYSFKALVMVAAVT